MTTPDDPPAIEAERRKGVSAAAIALLVLWLVLGGALAFVPGAPDLLTFLFVLAGWMMALIAHEFGHAFVAHKAGDHTVEAKGYLTLDPFKYADLGTSLVIPLIALALGGIGFPGGAVYLREDLMRSRAWRSAASLAGPVGTLLAFILLAALAQLWLGLAGMQGIALVAGLAFLAFLQATALILNLLPVPGLDGYGVIRPYLPAAVRHRLRKFEPLAMLGLLLALFFVPGVSESLIGTAVDLTQLAGVPGLAIASGFDAFRFWD